MESFNDTNMNIILFKISYYSLKIDDVNVLPHWLQNRVRYKYYSKLDVEVWKMLYVYLNFANQTELNRIS